MFTGIVEALGTIIKIESQQENLLFSIEAPFMNELKIDQSIAHNGVCLTVVKLIPNSNEYQVEAISETLGKTNLSDLQEGDPVNLERAMVFNGRMDGHLVQGHVDKVITCIHREEQEGSWLFRFEYDSADEGMIIEKGSVCLNGVSLTCFEVRENQFSVAIIPYTYLNTTFSNINVGDAVNIEFDVIGKYVSKQLSAFKKPV